MNIKPILFSTPMVQAILEGRKTMTRRLMPQPNEYITDINFGYSVLTPESFIEFRGYFIVDGEMRYGSKFIKCPYGKVGDILWVKEVHYLFGEWKVDGVTKKKNNLKYRFIPHDDNVMFEDKILVLGETFQLDVKQNSYHLPAWYKRLGRFMFKKHSRIFLKITDVRVERLQEISQADAIAEGIKSFRPVPGDGPAETQYYHYLKDKWGPSPIHSFKTLWQKINGEESWNKNPWVWALSFKRIDKPDNF